MRWITALLSAVVFTSPALAEECYYESGHDLGRIQFSADGNATLLLIGEPPEVCGVNEGDEGFHGLVCASDDEPYGSYMSFASSVPGGPEDDLLVLWDHVWYRQCMEPA
jgi:hypothetical protein